MISPEKHNQYEWTFYLRGLIALYVFFIPLIYGSVHFHVLITEYIIATLLSLTFLYFNRLIILNKPSLIFTLFIIFTMLITIFQLIPLPLPLLRILSNKEYELISTINGFYNQIIPPIKFYTISIEPYINLEYFIRIIVLLLIFIIASQSEFSESYILLRSIAYCGAVIVLYGFIEGLLNFKTYYSQYINLTNEGILPSVFINPNHQAGFLGLAAFTGISLYYSTEFKTQRLFYLFSAILSGAGIFLTLSRGGIIAFIASLLFLSVLLLKERFISRSSIIIFIGALITIIIAFYMAYQEITTELLTLTDVKRMENEKYRLVLNSIGLFKDFLITGVGKGGYETIFNLYREDTLFISFSLMENQLFQQLSDYGVIYFIIILALMGYFAFILFKNTLSLKTALLITAIFYIFLQNLVDFNLEIFSVQVATIIIIATLLSRFSHLKNEDTTPIYKIFSFDLSNKLFNIMGLIILFILLTGIILTSTNRREKIEAETELILNTNLPPDDPYFLSRIRRFPFNYYIPASIAARYYLDTGNKVIKSYLLHSSLINPIAFEPHYMLYRYFMKNREFAQAQSECRLALKYARDNKTRLIYSELLKNVDKKELFKYIPYIPEKITSFADYLINNSELALAREFIEDALHLSEENTDVLRSAFYIYIKLQDIKNAERTLNIYEKSDRGYTLNLMRGILYEIQNLNEDALKEYKKADELNPLNAEILLRIANLNTKIGNIEEARSYYLKVFLCDNISNETKVNIYISMAHTYLLQKNTYEALKYLRTALNLRPGDLRIKLQIASICERNGNLTCALNEYKEILIINPDENLAIEKIKTIEQRLKEIEEMKRIEQLQR
ncbi:MAG: O-antigen ligase family protein [Myxococcota bacterium]